jgi:hypothetical protein
MKEYEEIEVEITKLTNEMADFAQSSENKD